jgi:hypothetical protein
MRILVLVITLLGAQFLFADDHNFAVGACKPRLKSFPTIQAAVSGVPPGSTVLVCPGIYPEQVTISQSLTLQGIDDSNMDEAIITIPAGGAVANVSSVFSETVAAQLLVQTTGVVNISNITTDGTGGDSGCTNWLAGIFYSSGSSGSLTRVRTRNQIDTNCGVGIWAENGGTSREFLNLQSSSVHDADLAGLFVATAGTSALNLEARDNYVSSNNSVQGFDAVVEGITGDITDNDLGPALVGVLEFTLGMNIAANGIVGDGIGLLLLGPANAQSNDILNSGVGVSIGSTGTNVQSNHITLSSISAIDFGCNAANVSHNTINDAVVGLGDVPTGFNGNNNIANTTTVSTGSCPPMAPPMSPMLQAAPLASAPPSGQPFLQWRTPANPNGVRPH